MVNSFLAAVVYGTLSGKPIPQTEFENLPGDQAAALQNVANHFMTAYPTEMPTFGENCTEKVPPSFKIAYPAYTEEMSRQGGTGFLSARLQRLKETLSYFRKL